MSQKLASFAEKTLLVAAAIGAFIPLAVVRGFAHPFITPKQLLLCLAVIVGLPALLVLRNPKLPRGRRSPIFWAVAALLLTQGVATIFSIEPAVSFWGFAERLTGFFSVALFALFGYMLFVLFQKPERRRQFLTIWSVAWGAVAVFAVVERFKLIGMWVQFHGQGGRVVSTVGNPIFLAGGLILASAVIAAAISMRASGKMRTVMLLLVGALTLTVVAFTETRGAYIGLMAGIVVSVFVLARWSGRPAFRHAALFMPVVFLAGLFFVWFFRATPFVAKNTFLSRTASIFSKTDASVSQRFMLWGMAGDAIHARPLTGWGPEVFDTALDRMYNPAFTRYDVANSFSDRAHNAYLDVAATAGIPGMLAYVGFLIVLTTTILELRKRGQLGNGAAAIALGGLAAYAVAGLTSFDTHTTLLGLTVGAALLASLRPKEGETARSDTPSSAYVLAAVGGSIALFFTGVVPLARGAVVVHRVTVAADAETIAREAPRIKDFGNPYRSAQEHRIGNEIFKRVGNGLANGETARSLLAVAEELLSDASARRPENFGTRFTLGNILLLQAIHGIRPFDDASVVFEQARLLAPKRQIVDYQIANSFLAQKKYDEALQALLRAHALDPSIVESQWHLARGLASAGRVGEAASLFRSAWLEGFRGKRPADEFVIAINTLLQNGDIADLPVIRSIYEEWVQSDQMNANLWASLAAVRAEMGDKEAAIEALRRAVELDSSLRQELPAFIERYGLPPELLQE